MEAPALASLLSEPLLDRKALAHRLRLSEDTLQKWTVRKRIPHFRLGHRTVRYSYVAVIASLGSNFELPKAPFKRRLPRRKVIITKQDNVYQGELGLEFDQLLLPLGE
jgi:hypothetical protein